MLPVEYNYEIFWEQKTRPVQVTRSRKKTSAANPKAKYVRRLLFKTGILLFIYGIVLVYLAFQGSSLGYKIVALENEVEKLYSSNARLDYEVAQLSSLDSIEYRANQELGMKKPDMSVALTIPASVLAVTKESEPQPEEINPVSSSKAADIINSALLLLTYKFQ